MELSLKFFVTLVLLLIGPHAFANEAESETLEELSKSKEWNCTTEKTLKMTEAADGSTDVFAPLCVYKVSCLKIGATMRKRVTTICKLTRDNCMDLKDCIEHKKTYTPEELFYGQGRFTSERAQPENIQMFGEQCRQIEEVPYIVYRQDPKKPKSYDALCASPVAGCKMPALLKGSFLAVCKAEQVKGGFDLCPPPQDCLANPVPVSPAMTVSEAKALAASKDRTVAPGAGGSNVQKAAHENYDPKVVQISGNRK